MASLGKVRVCVCASCRTCKNYSFIGTIPKDFHQKFLDHCGGESG